MTDADPTKRVLVMSSSSPRGVPTIGCLVANLLNRSGTHITLIGKSPSRLGRLLDTLIRGSIHIPAHAVALVDVYGHFAFTYESFAILYARFCGKYVVVMLHSGFMPEFVELWPRWSRFVLSRPDLVLVPNEFLKRRLCDLGLRIDGCIPNFVHLENYNFRKRTALEPRFLYLRGMHPDQNPSMAIEAFALIQKQYPEALLTMAGRDGTDLPYCRALVKSLGLRNVNFVGMVPKQDIPLLADRHDIHLHTNRVENMPVSIIEMWASGLPIVGTRVGGMPDLVRQRQDAILVESEDHQAMAEACFELLANPELSETLCCNGRARALSLTWEQVKPLWEQALRLTTEETVRKG